MAQITRRLTNTSPSKPKTKRSKALRTKHRKDDVKLLKQDLKYNLSHARDHKKEAQRDRTLIRQKRK